MSVYLSAPVCLSLSVFMSLARTLALITDGIPCNAHTHSWRLYCVCVCVRVCARASVYLCFWQGCEAPEGGRAQNNLRLYRRKQQVVFGGLAIACTCKRTHSLVPALTYILQRRFGDSQLTTAFTWHKKEELLEQMGVCMRVCVCLCARVLQSVFNNICMFVCVFVCARA